MKDEHNGEQVLEFVGLRAKLYAFRTLRGDQKKCKGVKKGVVDKDIKFNDYRECLFTGESTYKTMNVFRSRGHEIYTEAINKTALSANDDKRHILPDGINTLALGHYKIDKCVT